MAQQSAFQHLLAIVQSIFSGFNWVDYAILVVFLFYIIEGAIVGFFGMLFDFASFVLSFAFGLLFYHFAARFFISSFSMPQGFSDAAGFFIIAFVSEVLLNILFSALQRFLNSRSWPFLPTESKALTTVDHILGIIPGFSSATVLLLFIVTLIMSLPVSPFLRKSITDSQLGSQFVSHTQTLASSVNGVFGGAVHDALTFLTVEPKSNSIVTLHFTVADPTPDSSAEQQMFVFVNKERTSRGLLPLVFDDRLRDVARAHAKDMFVRGYFSHYTPEGLSPFDRMGNAGISFQAAGENLALAPNVTLAMQGLMQSPGHRANILSTDFGRVGIGVMDGGVYGEMFAQEFTN